jgi:hypothetical protein
MAEQPTEPAGMRRDRREHGGAPARLDDDALARRTERERVDAGLDDYDPDDVTPATDVPPTPDITASAEYQEAEEEIRREIADGDLSQPAEKRPFPPSHYDR